MSLQQQEITGIILAGGRGSRMNGEDKGLISLNGVPLYHHVLQRLQPQVKQTLISANRNITRYQESGCLVVSDIHPDFAGPLAGILASLRAIDTEWAAFVSCDTPFIPLDLITRLWSAKRQAKAVWVRNDNNDHPTLSIIHHSVADRLEQELSQGHGRLMLFLQQIGGHAVIFDDDPQVFINMNTPDDMKFYQENH
ncbi:molybdopterin-guanine dinucleotide biosynthesis protein MobA [[Pantoea] beijingensis]|uniref:Molybdenum cofactor guanylyltransferase n=1 Tax=[Pantoea] beijingensis TaxID=1324864 RepID=A0A443IGG4_9GAMM|nr:MULTISPECIES: molybdenum cofactor guanylyltransferase MobA [Erwiniaceae]RWR03139.1 molybdopterin-guanine dinucleotide biosynthesis protein MobA [[Pantoea] beijingensis]